jgi:hypothetical protein
MLVIPFCRTQSPPSDFAKTHKLTFHPRLIHQKQSPPQDERKQGRKKAPEALRENCMMPTTYTNPPLLSSPLHSHIP